MSVVPTVNVFVVRYENEAVVVVEPEEPPDIILAIAPLFPVIFSQGWNISAVVIPAPDALL